MSERKPVSEVLISHQRKATQYSEKVIKILTCLSVGKPLNGQLPPSPALLLYLFPPPQTHWMSGLQVSSILGRKAGLLL